MTEGGLGDELGPLSSPPRDYRAKGRLLDGRPVFIRAVRPSDKKRLLDGFRKLSEKSIYLRFFQSKKELSEKDLAYLTELDFESHVGLLALLEEEGRRYGIGVGRYIVGPEPHAAEVAFAVDETHRGLGVATLLLHHLARIARAAGIRELHAYVLYENQPMIEVFEHAGYPMDRELEGNMLKVVLHIEPEP